jgi:hypothetical protein
MMARSNQPKARVAVELVEGVDAARKHREGRLRGFHVEGERHRHVLGTADAPEVAPDERAARVGLGCHALERAARVVLVLQREHRRERRVREAQPSRDQRREVGTELLVGRHHRLDAAPAMASDQLLDEGERVEGEEARVVRES